MTQEELNERLSLHQMWLDEKDGGVKLSLCGANLRGANLRMADLRGANLRGANLRGANLRMADLRRADLYRADLYGVDLRGADLCMADLRRADLYRADLYGADLYGVDLCMADLRGAKNIPEDIYPIACPDTGSFIGWKKAVDEKIVKLEITEDALRSSATTRKCRCSKAKVLAIENMDGSPSGLKKIASKFGLDFIYKIGEIVKVDNFDKNRWNECTTGIHFFITREEAVKY